MKSLDELTAPKIDQGGPPGAGTFAYVDISSIDNQSKRIVEPKHIPADEAPSRAKQRLHTGDVLVSMTRPNLNAVALVSHELNGAIGSTGFHVLRAAETVLPQWLYYGVQSQRFIKEMSALVQGALYPAVRPKDIRGFQLPTPKLDEQHRIVAEIEKQFSRLDQAVASLQRVKAQLKRYKASVLKAAVEGRLVETEAERARREGRGFETGAELAAQGSANAARGRKPGAALPYETGEQLLKRILDTRRSQWKGKGKYREPAAPDACSLPELPEGWVWATVEQLNLANKPCAYGVLQPGDEMSDGIPLVRVGDIDDGLVKQGAIKRIAPQVAAQYPRTKLVGGEFLITLVGAIGRTALVPDSLAGANVARAVGVVPLAREIDAHWFEMWFRNPAKVVEMTSKSHEVARKTLNLEDVRVASVAVPPLAEQHRIGAEVDRRLSIVREVEAEVDANLKRAQALRQSVLGAAFSGRLTGDAAAAAA